MTLYGAFTYIVQDTRVLHRLCPLQAALGGRGFPVFLLIGFFQVTFNASLARPIPLPQL